MQQPDVPSSVHPDNHPVPASATAALAQGMHTASSSQSDPSAATATESPASAMTTTTTTVTSTTATAPDNGRGHNPIANITSSIAPPTAALPTKRSSERRGRPRGHRHTRESRRKIGLANRGNIPWNKGRPHSEATKRKIAENTRRAMLRPELRQFLKQRALGRRHTEETKMKIGRTARRVRGGARACQSLCRAVPIAAASMVANDSSSTTNTTSHLDLAAAAAAAAAASSSTTLNTNPAAAVHLHQLQQLQFQQQQHQYLLQQQQHHQQQQQQKQQIQQYYTQHNGNEVKWGDLKAKAKMDEAVISTSDNSGGGGGMEEPKHMVEHVVMGSHIAKQEDAIVDDNIIMPEEDDNRVDNAVDDDDDDEDDDMYVGNKNNNNNKTCAVESHCNNNTLDFVLPPAVMHEFGNSNDLGVGIDEEFRDGLIYDDSNKMKQHHRRKQDRPHSEPARAPAVSVPPFTCGSDLGPSSLAIVGPSYMLRRPPSEVPTRLQGAPGTSLKTYGSPRPGTPGNDNDNNSNEGEEEEDEDGGGNFDAHAHRRERGNIRSSSSSLLSVRRGDDSVRKSSYSPALSMSPFKLGGRENDGGGGGGGDNNDGVVASLAKPQGLDAATATADGAVASGAGTGIGSDVGQGIDFEQQPQQGGAGLGSGRYCSGLGERRKASGGVGGEVGVFEPDAKLPADMNACFDLGSLDNLAAVLAAPPASPAIMGGGGSGTAAPKAATQQQQWNRCGRPGGDGGLTVAAVSPPIAENEFTAVHHAPADGNIDMFAFPFTSLDGF